MIHVCYGLYDADGRYSKFVGTSIASIFENTREDITIHILHNDTLTTDNRDKFNYLAGHYHQQIKFYNVDELIPKDIERIKDYMPRVKIEKYHVGKLYRLFLPKIISNLDKVIYLDSDTVVNCEINDLWQIDIGNYPLAAVNESNISAERLSSAKLYLLEINLVDFNDYFNSGVLVLNLKYIREHFNLIWEGCKFYNDNLEHFILFDQEILNYCFANNYLKLSNDFNLFVDVERKKSNQLHRGIFHYTACTLNFNPNDVYNKLFFNHFSKTPWFNENIFSHMFESLIQFNAQHKMQLVQLSMILSGKRRAFLTEQQNLESTQQFFLVQPNEKVLITPPRSMNHFLNQLYNSKANVC